MTAKVYFTDMHVRMGDSLLGKFDRLITRAGIEQIDFKDKFVAVKLHFGEVGNMAFLRQQYARVLCDHIKRLGGKPFLTDCNTLYVGYRNSPQGCTPSSPTACAAPTNASFPWLAANT